MSDWKDTLRNSQLNKSGGGGMEKKCKTCGKILKEDSRFDTCFECGKKNKKEGTGFKDDLPPEYISKLDDGYFDSNNCLWEEFLTTMANKVAKSFTGRLKNHQLRRFYAHAKAAENRLRMTGDWNAVNLDIKKIIPFASEAIGKDKIPRSFYDFLEKNINTIRKKDDFEKGFMEHFQAVVAYFTYHYPKS